MNDSYQRLRDWADRILDEDPGVKEFWLPLWEAQGKLRCVHCARPIYYDDGPMGSGYYFHMEKTDGTNGLYCSKPFGQGKTAYPSDETGTMVEKEIAEAVRALLNEVSK